MVLKKKIFLSLGVLCFGLESFNAQNLVRNPSFEDTIHCPTNPGQILYTTFWNSPTQGSPDYFNSCCSTGMGVPNNGDGTQLAMSGIAYAGLFAFSKSLPNYREYIQTNLTNTLAINHKYFVSFYVNLADVSEYSISTIGAFFSSAPISNTTSLTLSYSPQIQNKPTNVLNDKINWMNISDTLYSDGTEQYITIGNFNTDVLSDTNFLGTMFGGHAAYYYIDSVSVIDYGLMGVNQFANNTQLNIYPNPAHDLLTVECKAENSELRITDVMSNEIKKQKIKDKKEVIDISEIQIGVYFVSVQTLLGVSTKKIIIQH
jgi:OmpA-OmpF porin, OOP family